MKQLDINARFAHEAFGLQARQIDTITLAFRKSSESALDAGKKGPGGGPDATPLSNTLLTLAVTSGANWLTCPAAAMALYQTPLLGNDAGEECQPGIVETVSIPHGPMPLSRCEITGALCFGDALVAIYASADMADEILRIEVRQSKNDAAILARDGRVSRFVSDPDRAAIEAQDARGDYRTVAMIGGATMAAIAREIAS